VRGHSGGGQLEHLLGCVDADDRAGGADLALQHRQAQPGAAAHIEDDVAAPHGQLCDEQFAPVAEGVGALIVVAGLAAVGLRPWVRKTT
jgi:hypothetical protein